MNKKEKEELCREINNMRVIIPIMDYDDRFVLKFLERLEKIVEGGKNHRN